MSCFFLRTELTLTGKFYSYLLLFTQVYTVKAAAYVTDGELAVIAWAAICVYADSCKGVCTIRTSCTINVIKRTICSFFTCNMQVITGIKCKTYIFTKG